MRKLSLKSAISSIRKEIESKLDVEIYGIERVVKIYGSNANSFIVRSIDENSNHINYFLKFLRNNELHEEIEGTQTISRYLPTPQIILTSEANTHEWVLYQQIEGNLLTEILLDHEENNTDPTKLLRLEKKKEILLQKMYSQTKSKISFEEYVNLRTNALFLKRINGSRFDNFYSYNESCLSRYFDNQIILNGHNFDNSINDIFSLIRSKYKSVANKHKSVHSTLGHGDGHHGNIIIDKNDEIHFIDNEYFGSMPAFMELSKPYYNDFIGELFFHYNDLLDEYFDLQSIHIDKNLLQINIKPKKHLTTRLALTMIKLKFRERYINKKTDLDFLSLNDYLVMCHTLTRNPNHYQEKSKYLFLVFTLILADFDPLDPESLYKYF